MPANINSIFILQALETRAYSMDKSKIISQSDTIVVKYDLFKETWPVFPGMEIKCSYFAFMQYTSFPVSLRRGVFRCIINDVIYILACEIKVAVTSSTKIAMEFLAIFFAFTLLNTYSCASPGLVLENYSQLAQKFGLPPLPPLPIKFNFSDISKECQDTVANLSQSASAYSCEYNTTSFVFYLDVWWLKNYPWRVVSREYDPHQPSVICIENQSASQNVQICTMSVIYLVIKWSRFYLLRPNSC